MHDGQIFLITNALLVPPKPKELLSTVLTSVSTVVAAILSFKVNIGGNEVVLHHDKTIDNLAGT